MKTLLMIFILGLTTSLVLAAESKDDIKLDLPVDWPTISLNEKTLQQLKDSKFEYYLIDFWASWCEPCQESLPFYLSEMEKMKLKDWALVAVNVDSEKKDADEFLKKIKIPTWVLFDQERKLSKKLKIGAIPVLYFVDKTGHVLKVEKGFTEKSKTQFRETVESILKSSQQAGQIKK